MLPFDTCRWQVEDGDVEVVHEVQVIIVASCVVELGLGGRGLWKIHCMENSPLGPRVRVDEIYKDCESGISGIFLIVDLRVVDISGFDVLLDMDELTAHRVVNVCHLRRVIILDTVLELCKVSYACE